jgi:hypothetical protein
LNASCNVPFNVTRAYNKEVLMSDVFVQCIQHITGDVTYMILFETCSVMYVILFFSIPIVSGCQVWQCNNI